MLATLAVTYPIFLQTLGYKVYGLWLMMATVLNLAQLSNLGLGPALARLVAHDYGKTSTNLGRHWTSAMLMATVSGALMVMGVVTLRGPAIRVLRIEGDLVAQALLLLPIVASLAVLILIVEITGAVLVGVGRSDLNSYSQASAQTMATLMPVLLIHAGFGIMSFPIATFIAYGIAELLLLFLLRRNVALSRLGPMRFSAASVKELVTVGFALSGSSALQLVLVSSIRVFLSRYAGLSAIPIYDLAYNGSLRLRNVIETGLRALMPEISHLRARRDSSGVEGIRRIYNRATLLTLAVGIPVYATVAYSSGFVLRAWLGSIYVEEFHVALQVGLLATFLSLLGVPAYYTLMGLGAGRPLFAEKALHAGVQLSLIFMGVLVLGQLSSTTVLMTGVAGMGSSTIYLIWRARTATGSLRSDLDALSCEAACLRATTTFFAPTDQFSRLDSDDATVRVGGHGTG